MTPAEELTAAETKLRKLIAPAATELATSSYYTSYDPPSAWSEGIINGLGGDVAELAGTINLEATRSLADVLGAWARMGRLDLDLLHRVGGPETLAVARRILGTEGDPG